jgi:uncharacterized membrane protein (UPF0127 family)
VVTAAFDETLQMAALMSLRDDDDNQRTHRPRRLPSIVRIVDSAGNEVCTHCEVAERAVARMRGLLGRDGLEPGTGMLINGAPSIQMFFMRFPIDVVFLGRDKSIVGISHDVKPWRTAGARGAFAALELPAGTAKAHGLTVGDTLTIVPVDTMPRSAT